MEEHLPIQNQVGVCLHEQCVAVFGALETSSTTSPNICAISKRFVLEKRSNT